MTLPQYRLALLGLGLIARAAMPSAAPAQQGPDTFDELQQNVWYLPVDSGRSSLYATSMGHGRPVVVLHGGPGNDFNYLVPALRPLAGDFKFILFDQRGSLLSPVAPQRIASLRLHDLVEDLEALRGALGQDRLVLLAHSFGTMLAVAYYRAYPEHVAGIVLTAAVPPVADSVTPFNAYIRQSRRHLRALQQRPSVAEELQKAGVPSNGSSALTPLEQSLKFRIGLASFNIHHIERWRLVQGGGVYYNSAVDDAIGDSIPQVYDVRTAIAAHPVPITVIQGDDDYLELSAKEWDVIARTTPMIEVRVLHDAGHYSWVDDSVGFRREVAAGLARATLPRTLKSPPNR